MARFLFVPCDSRDRLCDKTRVQMFYFLNTTLLWTYRFSHLFECQSENNDDDVVDDGDGDYTL